MDRQQIIDYILKSDIFKKWHFFSYHFDFYNKGFEHPLAKSIVDMTLDLENVMPKSGINYIDKIASIIDKKDETKHYDQLMQVLAELIIVHKAATYNWGNNMKLAYEPVAGNSNKNPELSITTDNLAVGIEVKAPELVKKHNERGTKPQQIASRSDIVKLVKKDETMLPRDNPVKDFLISANKKFEEFKKANPNFFAVLVIVWDDFIYEPISALSSPQAGLLTANSFAKDYNGAVLEFPNVDCVILTRHLLPIKNGTRDEELHYYYQHPLDYGRAGEFPFKVFIQNPSSKLTIPKEVIDCFQALKPGPELGAEYLPSDFITWMDY
ncbi:MAG: hypothetical protein JSR97_01365 [Verrucomicrobia bacterium]|nr:hypothetical protein [Verrucomicrobiota bacterium]